MRDAICRDNRVIPPWTVPRWHPVAYPALIAAIFDTVPIIAGNLR